MTIQNVFTFARRELKASPFIPSAIVFVAGLTLVGFGWQTAKRDAAETRNSLIEARATLSETNVLQQVYSYENALLSASSFILSSDSVNRHEWETFVTGLRISERRRGMLGLGYSEFITPSELFAYEARVRSEGFEGFRVWPHETEREVYSSITYIEPYDEVNMPALGYDMYSEPLRHEAMNRAIETGDPAMTSKVLLVQGGERRIPGLNLYQALYRKGAPLDTVEQRKAAVVGFVYSPFISDQLFGSVFHEKDENYNVKVYDGNKVNEDKLLYELHKGDDSYTWVRTDTLDIAGIQWTFEFGIKDTVVPAPIRERPRNTLVGGIILTTITALLVYLLLQWRAKSFRDKEERDVQRAKDNMLSLASHQLRTPATGVKQYIGMVLEGFAGELQPEQKKFLRHAYDSNERQLRIINEFLYLAKADADRIVVSPQRFDLGQLVNAVIQSMQGEIDEAGHALQVNLGTRRVFCAADMHCMRMIIENLLSNAVKYTPAGGTIDVTVKTKNKESLVIIKDTGVGIAEEDFPKLFKQFSRIPNALTRQTSGSGIGLYLAQQLAKRNKGYITVVSEVGNGSEFTLHMTAKSVKNFTETSDIES